MNDQKALLRIVQKWKINPKPEYRGFRCANCQRFLHKAFHHHLSYEGFNTPVHFCRICQRKLRFSGKLRTPFTCDNCGRNMFKSFHVWTKKVKTMWETHFCKKCFLNPAKLF